MASKPKIFKFKNGDRVAHTIFGEGTVQKFGPGFLGTTIVIAFDNGGTKELAMAFTGKRLTRV